MWSTPPRVARCNGLHHPHWEEPKMKFAHSVVAAAVSLGFCTAAFAQAGTVQRDVNQQQRIEQGKARLSREQNQVSRDIYREKHDAQTGNPNSASSQRMQADVQRNINQ